MARLILHTSELKGLYGAWLDQCKGERFPSAADLEPAVLRPWLDHLVLVEVQLDGNYRYLYYGESLASAFGTDMVGRSVEDLPAHQRNVLKAEYDELRASRFPAARVYTALFNGREETWERLALPFFDSQGEVVAVMVAAYRLEP
ncbi:PAS domain-containing protein [Telmatospirillum sp. J64-1]|uniref:PAS domain-containing protein n=1 Tax=Telmatospirillum sp. J64-1 TaxID=2502183 RepID=UPI00115D00C4|nr:PAS domain-containing protein [Telmatospirillum sp. J64-1]